MAIQSVKVSPKLLITKDGGGGSLYFMHLILMFKIYVMFVAIFYSDNVCF